jgi:hypothetical protein
MMAVDHCRLSSFEFEIDSARRVYYAILCTERKAQSEGDSRGYTPGGRTFFVVVDVQPCSYSTVVAVPYCGVLNTSPLRVEGCSGKREWKRMEAKRAFSVLILISKLRRTSSSRRLCTNDSYEVTHEFVPMNVSMNVLLHQFHVFSEMNVSMNILR